MKNLKLTVIIIVCFWLLIIQEGQAAPQDEFEYYRQLNEKEKRLPEYRDSDESLKLKLLQLEVINASRKKFRAQPVRLDILASRVANKMCREAAENDYISHWNLAGEKPYHRYAFAGGYDHVSENAYGMSTTGSLDLSSSSILRMMKEGHDGFMREKAPNNGHKKNIIDKMHNRVGIGFHATSGRFRYYEEFLNSYLAFSNIPSELRPGEQSVMDIDTGGSLYLYFMVIYREDFPKPRTAAQLRRTGSYGDYSDETYLSVPAWDLARYRKGSRYSIPVSFSREGLYYIHIFTDEKEYTGPGSLTTKGRSPVSGIVVKVRK